MSCFDTSRPLFLSCVFLFSQLPLIRLFCFLIYLVLSLQDILKVGADESSSKGDRDSRGAQGGRKGSMGEEDAQKRGGGEREGEERGRRERGGGEINLGVVINVVLFNPLLRSPNNGRRCSSFCLVSRPARCGSPLFSPAVSLLLAFSFFRRTCNAYR